MSEWIVEKIREGAEGHIGSLQEVPRPKDDEKADPEKGVLAKWAQEECLEEEK